VKLDYDTLNGTEGVDFGELISYCYNVSFYSLISYSYDLWVADYNKISYLTYNNSL